jgi:hypothetical protein
MLAYFVGEKVKMRRFNVVSVYDMIVEADDNLVVIAEMSDLQRLMGWSDKESSAIEIVLAPSYKDEETIKDITMTVGTVVNAYSEDSEYPVIATSSLSRFPQIFDWLDLMNALFYDVNPIPVKAAMALQGQACGGCRLPLTEMPESSLNLLKKVLVKHGLIKT